MRWRGWSWLVVGALWLAPPARAQTEQGRFAEILQAFALRQHVVGIGAVYVERGGKRLTALYGEEDPARHLPFSTRTPLAIGSLTKSFVGYWFERTAARHRLALAERVGPDGPTLGELFAHAGGLQPSWPAGMFTTACPPPPLSDAELLGLLPTRDPSIFRYSNLGYELIQRTVARKLGEDFKPSLMHELAPLGLVSTGWMTCDSPLAPGFNAGVRQPRTALREAAAGGLVSNLDDMGRYALALATNRAPDGSALLPEPAYRQLFTNQIPPTTASFGLRYGLGWNLNGVGQQGNEPIVWHRGGFFPYQGHLVLVPGAGRALVILANSQEAEGDVFNLARDLLAAGSGQPVTPEAYAPAAPVPLDALAGDYAGLLGEFSPLEHRGNVLTGPMLGQTIALEPTASGLKPQLKLAWGLLTIDLPGLNVVPREANGQRYLVAEGYGQPLITKRLGPPAPLPASWQAALGDYDLGRRDTATRVLLIKHCRLLVERGRLLARVTLQNPGVGPELESTVALRAVDDATAVFENDNSRVRLLPGAIDVAGFVLKR